MSVVNAIVLYVIIWWVVLFAVLPWGVRRNEAPEPGHDPGAPANPNLGRKAIYTTVIAAAVWLAAYGLISSDLISFRE